LKAEPVDENLIRHKSNWLPHVTRMNSNRMAKIMLNYRSNGGRRLARPLRNNERRPKHVYRSIKA